MLNESKLREIISRYMKEENSGILEYPDKKRFIEGGIVLGTEGEGTIIADGVRDGKNKVLSYDAKKRMHQLERVFQYHVLSKRGLDKKRDYLIGLISRICRVLNIPASAREIAITLCEKAFEALLNDKKVKNINHLMPLAAACLLIALRDVGKDAPYSLKEILQVFEEYGYKVKGQAVIRFIKILREKFGIKVKYRRCEDYIPRFVGSIIADEEVEERCKEEGVVLEEYGSKLMLEAYRIARENRDKIVISGRRPYVVASAVIYIADKILAFKEGRRPILTQALISRICNVSGNALRECYSKVFKEYLKKKGIPFMELRSYHKRKRYNHL